MRAENCSCVTEGTETFTNGGTESTEDERRRVFQAPDFDLKVAGRTLLRRELLAPRVAGPSGRPKRNRERDRPREQLSVARRAVLFSVRPPVSPFLRL